eukprot:2447313-Amphidinium_carterae.1
MQSISGCPCLQTELGYDEYMVANVVRTCKSRPDKYNCERNHYNCNRKTIKNAILAASFLRRALPKGIGTIVFCVVPISNGNRRKWKKNGCVPGQLGLRGLEWTLDKSILPIKLLRLTSAEFTASKVKQYLLEKANSDAKSI